MDKDVFYFVGIFVLFFGMLFGSMMYDSAIKQECRLKAIEKGYTAIEIQGICK
jgi:hypothetical protein